MKAIFVSSAYSGANAWEVEKRVRSCEEASFAVAELGGSPSCVNVLGRFFNGTLTYERWIEIAFEQIRRADAVYLAPGWEASSGVAREVAFAESLGKPVLRTLDELRSYLAA